MKKAVLYARVSSDVQKKEKTIESQVEELKRQIKQDGNALVKEYIDEGYSGAMLDRPAMNQLRADMKTDIFEIIYFLVADRIARDVTYQTIIVEEIIKNEKRVVINGKDYIENPENKFTLQVLGAVSQLERAKIIERSMRGKQHKLRAGFFTGNGSHMFGYTYIPKTQTAPGYFAINEVEAKIVQFAFTQYAKGNMSMSRLSRELEEMGALTKTGKKLWGFSSINHMLRQTSYAGIKYFNTVRIVKEYGNPLVGTKTTRKLVHRDKSEWVGIPVPAIVSKEVFDKVQERRAWNKSRYRNPRKTQLLSSLVKCGHCGSSFYSYQRYLTTKKNGVKRTYHKVAYRCCNRLRQMSHAKSSEVLRCPSRERSATVLDGQVANIIVEIMLDPIKLRTHMEIFKTNRPHPRMEKQLLKVEKSIYSHEEKKRRIMDIYADGKLPKEAYVAKSREIDNTIGSLTAERISIMEQMPLFRKTKFVDLAIQQFCESAKLRYKQCNDFEAKRQFLIDYVDKIIYMNDRLTVQGFVPVTVTQHGKESETSRVEFRIEVGASKEFRNQYDKQSGDASITHTFAKSENKKI